MHFDRFCGKESTVFAEKVLTFYAGILRMQRDWYIFEMFDMKLQYLFQLIQNFKRCAKNVFFHRFFLETMKQHLLELLSDGVRRSKIVRYLPTDLYEYDHQTFKEAYK